MKRQFFLLAFPTDVTLLYSEQSVLNTTRGQIRQTLDRQYAQIASSDASQLLFYDSDTAGLPDYTHFLIRYLTMDPNARLVSTRDLPTLSTDGYRYFLCASEDDEVRQYALAHFGTDALSEPVDLSSAASAATGSVPWGRGERP